MLIYINELLQEVDDLAEYAQLIKDKFENKYDSKSILFDAQGISKRVQYLVSILPEGISSGNANRHCDWLVYYLNKGDTNRCLSDISDLIEQDFPHLMGEINSWSNDLQYIDEGLRQEIRALVRIGQFDSAIRKCFVVLKTRICETFGLENDKDGEALSNDLFGKKSEYFEGMNGKQKAAMRSYCAGLFGILRNPFAHNNIDASLVDTDVAISSVNYLLKTITEHYPEGVKKQL
ncbi:TIGR02391 family protein [Oceanospirillaceae bacterium]|nr:TIGR02391 family protein [Oceanospirillaceae bacterium]